MKRHVTKQVFSRDHESVVLGCSHTPNAPPALWTGKRVKTPKGFGTVLGYECFTRLPKSREEVDWRIEASPEGHATTHRLGVQLDNIPQYWSTAILYFRERELEELPAGR